MGSNSKNCLEHNGIHLKSGPKRVCVIGGGVVGLVAIKHINESEGLVGTVFEQMDRIGGLWFYVDTEKDVNDLPVHSALYPGLRANAPKEFLEMHGFAFPDYENGSSFLSHRNIQRYLEDYAERFNLMRNVKLNTRVLSVKPTKPENNNNIQDNEDESETTWKVKVHNYKTNTTEEHIFDAVIVGNGKFIEPLVPEVNGINEFEGLVLHTKLYRRPEQFKGQHVVVVGFGPSAIDIAREINEVTDNVTILHRTPFDFPSKAVRILKGNIAQMKKRSVLLESGEELPCDSLLLATGYNLSYPFLHPDCGIEIEDGKFVTPLFKHMMSLKYPTLCIPNLFSFSPEWTVTDIQLHYFVRYLEGKIKIPAEKERWSALEAEIREWDSKKVPIRHRLRLGEVGQYVYPYMHDLAQLGGFQDVIHDSPLRHKCMFIGIGRLFGHIDVFRKDRVRWTGPNSVSYHCYMGEDENGKVLEEHLNVEMDETGEVSVTSSLGTIHNKPFPIPGLEKTTNVL